MPKIYGRHTAKQHQQFIEGRLSLLAFLVLLITYPFKKMKSLSGENIAKICIFVGVMSIFNIFNVELDFKGRLHSAGMGAAMAAGGYVYVDRKRQKKITETKSGLDRTFYQLITRKKGKVSLLEWVAESQLSKADAREYLDKKAAEWGATFGTTDNQTIIYQFPHS